MPNEDDGGDDVADRNPVELTGSQIDDARRDAQVSTLTAPTFFSTFLELSDILSYMNASYSTGDEEPRDEEAIKDGHLLSPSDPFETSSHGKSSDDSARLSKRDLSHESDREEKSLADDDDVSPVTSDHASTISDPDPPTSWWRQTLLTCLCTANGQSSRHLAVVSFLSGATLVVLPFAWTSATAHWTAVGVQVTLGVWSVGPTTAVLWFVPLTRTTHGEEHVADTLLYIHGSMPVFCLIVLMDVIMDLLVLIAHVVFLAQHRATADDDRVHVSAVVLPIVVARLLFLTACAVEPVIHIYHHFATIPFYPCCLCYCCCPRLFRRCHRWYTHGGCCCSCLDWSYRRGCCCCCCKHHR